MGKLLLKLAFPTFIAQLINLLYNVVDRIYIAQLGIDEALSGLTLCFPIVMTVIAFSSLIGMGGAPLASIKLGENDLAGAEKILGNSLFLGIIVSLLLTILLEIFKLPLLDAFGGNQASIPSALDYLRIYILGAIFVQIAIGLNNFITAQGFAKMNMLTVLIGAVLNIILDPIFIFALNLGVEGAAIATLISEALSALWVLFFLKSHKSTIKIKKTKIIPQKIICRKILLLGISPFIMQLTEALVQLLFNKGLETYARTPQEATILIASMGILFTVYQMIALPMMGITQGASPIISYNYGAQNLDRVKKCFQLLLLVLSIYLLLFYLLMEIFPQIFVKPLASSPEVVALAKNNLRIFLAGSLAFNLQYSCQQTFLALGKAKISLFLAIFRKLILLIPLALILPFFITPPTFGLILAEPIADVIAGLTTGLVFYFYFPKIIKKKTKTIES